ncbi:dephospho-CoA kinase [Bacteroidales bacterium OttesenSCG-928-B11]|nr:dephospho-CoA kinase [Bacteroidales bacterium OttesenSCG-928-E04]MDL2308788.1 dephospho-CoA kinase [Bacteroidales bacterium OttesenSCG-928-C03]MDL2311988.1 dephospho-CoA kinase [Bacteroidales bacterium OttesenSCG-928-B11]
MLRIALTGGIGTGKSYISAHYSAMGIPVFNADQEAQKLYDHPDVKQLVQYHFGKSVYQNGTLNKARLAQLIFSDQNSLSLINSIIHPRLMVIFDNWAIAQNKPVVMMESAIIFEAGLAGFFDLVFVVHASLEVRLKRLSLRNPEWDAAEIKRRMTSQVDQEVKRQNADMVIWNEEEGGEGIIYWNYSSRPKTQG